MQILKQVVMLTLMLPTLVALAQSPNHADIILSAVQFEVGSLDEQNAHYIPWEKIKDKYHVFVAVGVEDTGEPSSGVMQVIETLPSVRARSRGYIANANDIVRDIESCNPGEVLWVKQVSVIDESQAVVSAEVITAIWCKMGLTYVCCYEQGMWRVAAREVEWHICDSPHQPS